MNMSCGIVTVQVHMSVERLLLFVLSKNCHAVRERVFHSIMQLLGDPGMAEWIFDKMGLLFP